MLLRGTVEAPVWLADHASAALTTMVMIATVLLLLLASVHHTAAAAAAVGSIKNDDLKLRSGFTARLRPQSEFSGRASSLLATTTASGNVLSARDFGAVGDGVTDDAPALQRAIDAAQHSRKILALPAGIYLVNSSLRVHDNSGMNGPNGTAGFWNCSFPYDDNLAGPNSCPSALHLVGDGGWGLQTLIKGGTAFTADADGGSAIIDVGFGKPGPSVPRAGPGHGHEFSDFAVDAAGKAFHGIRAYAIVRSVAKGLVVMGAIDVGLEFGYGFINRIIDCNFVGSSIGVKSANQANSVIISNNNFEGQSFAAIVVGNSIGGMIIVREVA